MRLSQGLRYIKYIMLMLLVIVATLINSTPTFAYIASQVIGSSDNASGLVNGGQWKFTNQFVASADALAAHAQALQNSGNNYIDDLYNQTTTPLGAAVTLNSISIDGTTWSTYGSASGTSTAPRLGYVQIIDRSVMPYSNNAVFPILPPAPTTPLPYLDYNYFIANDVKNTVTNNIYAIRMNYTSRMTTSSTKYNIRTIKLYARRGLYVAGQDIRDLRTNATLSVAYSTNGSSFTTISSVTPGYSTATSAAFTLYTFNIPSSQYNKNLYFRITCNCGTTGTKSNAKYSRIVIENITFA